MLKVIKPTCLKDLQRKVRHKRRFAWMPVFDHLTKGYIFLQPYVQSVVYASQFTAYSNTSLDCFRAKWCEEFAALFNAKSNIQLDPNNLNTMRNTDLLMDSHIMEPDSAYNICIESEVANFRSRLFGSKMLNTKFYEASALLMRQMVYAIPRIPKLGSLRSCRGITSFKIGHVQGEDESKFFEGATLNDLIVNFPNLFSSLLRRLICLETYRERLIHCIEGVAVKQLPQHLFSVLTSTEILDRLGYTLDFDEQTGYQLTVWYRL
jgi:hypothetical protein